MVRPSFAVTAPLFGGLDGVRSPLLTSRLAAAPLVGREAVQRAIHRGRYHQALHRGNRFGVSSRACRVLGRGPASGGEYPMRYRFFTADVFTDRIFGGNPLAVVPQAEGLAEAQMQLIAREFNFSETVFVLPPQRPDHTRRLRIFTPTAEMPFAGHPTIGAAFVLAAVGEIALNREETDIVFEEEVGLVRVRVQATRGRPISARLSAAQTPQFGPAPPETSQIAAMLSLTEQVVAPEAYPLQAISCGVPYLIVPLDGLEAVRAIRVRRDLWETALASYWAPNIYAFSREAERNGVDLHARMFAPALGVNEDPATGAAALALAGYLARLDPLRVGTLRWRIEQGLEMGRPSQVEIEADKVAGEITAVRIAGGAVLVSEGSIEIPNNK